MKDPSAPVELDASLAVVLGSGLGAVCDRFELEGVVAFDALAGVGETGVSGHAGRIGRGRVAGRQCLFVQGRRHRYEGDGGAIEALVSVLHAAGVRCLLLTCAAGCLQAGVGAGSLMLLDDVIDFHLARHHHERRKGAGRASRGLPRRLVLDVDLGRTLIEAAGQTGVRLARGVLASLPGPMYETPSEIVALQRLGVDAVSMSVVPELAAASARGMRVAAVAHMTNCAAGLRPGALSHDEVLVAGREASEAVSRLITQFVRML